MRHGLLFRKLSRYSKIVTWKKINTDPRYDRKIKERTWPTLTWPTYEEVLEKVTWPILTWPTNQAKKNYSALAPGPNQKDGKQNILGVPASTEKRVAWKDVGRDRRIPVIHTAPQNSIIVEKQRTG